MIPTVIAQYSYGNSSEKDRRLKKACNDISSLKYFRLCPNFCRELLSDLYLWDQRLKKEWNDVSSLQYFTLYHIIIFVENYYYQIFFYVALVFYAYDPLSTR